jgi:hypothetical protein
MILYPNYSWEYTDDDTIVSKHVVNLKVEIIKAYVLCVWLKHWSRNNNNTVFFDYKGTCNIVPVHAMTTCGEAQVWLCSFLAMVLGGDKWSVSSPGHCTRR